MNQFKTKLLSLLLNPKTFTGIVSFSFIVIIGGYINKHTEPTLKIVEKEKVKVIEKIIVRTASADLVPHLKNVEGYRDKPYMLGDGAVTIGYGHAVFKGEKEGYEFLEDYNGLRRKKTKITFNQAEILLFDDLKDAEKNLNKLLDDLNQKGCEVEITQGMYNAMISMIFNMGFTGFRKSDFFKKIEENNLISAKNEILKTSKKLFIKHPGLKVRRKSEYEMFK